MKRILVGIMICICSSAYAQKESLTLDNAILARWNKYAPDRIKLENGIEAKILYTANGPKISIVLQKLYDVNVTPLLCNGKIPVSIEVLGPNHRPVQTTTDMSRFWNESYPDIKKQLKGRYPKHEWR